MIFARQNGSTATKSDGYRNTADGTGTHVESVNIAGYIHVKGLLFLQHIHAEDAR